MKWANSTFELTIKIALFACGCLDHLTEEDRTVPLPHIVIYNLNLLLIVWDIQIILLVRNKYYIAYPVNKGVDAVLAVISTWYCKEWTGPLLTVLI